MEDNNKSPLTKWLENLQQESWQLELLISGFAIFLLIGSYEPITQIRYQIDLLVSADTFYRILEIPYYILIGSWVILVVNLTMHIFLRGLWISTIGLRYVSGDVDFKELNFHSKFDHFLKRKVGSFDIYIHQLEKLCSVIFAFTFLIVFLLISIGVFVLMSVMLFFGAQWILLRTNESIVWFLLEVVIFFILTSALFYFIDFITMGKIKRIKFLVKIYYPIYRFYSLITLSFLYRPLYYNLIDNKFGRKVLIFLIPYAASLLIIMTISIRTSAYFPTNRQLQSLYNTYYEDKRDFKIPSYSASIPSKFVDNGYIPLYLPYISQNDDKVIYKICPDLKPAKTGIYLFGRDDPYRASMDAQTALDCSSDRFRIYVNDSLLTNLKYRFYEHPDFKNNGLLTVLDVAYLPRGEHSLAVHVLLFKDFTDTSDLFFRETAVIPFWKE